MSRTQKLLVFMAVLSLTIFACSLSSNNKGNASVEIDEPNDVLFRDDFSSPNSGWDRAENEYATTDYGDDVYKIEIFSADYIAWASPGKNFTDVVIEVETFKSAGGDDNGFGIVCRHEDTENFYMLEISSDGYAWIGKYSQGEFEALEVIESNEVNLGNVKNSLRAECIDDRLSLYVNGSLEIEVFDSDLTDGDIGVVAETFTDESAEILFDNFLVTRP